MKIATVHLDFDVLNDRMNGHWPVANNSCKCDGEYYICAVTISFMSMRSETA